MPNHLTIKEIKQYPESAFEKLKDAPTPTTQGTVTVSKQRDGPFNLYYELYGTGPNKILWLCGHGDGLEGYHRYVREFGLDESARHTSLLLENRGIGRSEAPWSFCTMTDLAKDAIDVLDELEWNEDRSVHLVGHSMGGMIAMRMAIEAPARIASLTLISTTSYWMNDLSLLSSAKNILFGFVPKNEDRRMADTKAMLFGESWLAALDERGIFPTNGDAWVARNLGSVVHYKGAIVTMPACVKHHVRPEELRAIANNIGGSRIQILHGRADNLAPVSAAESTFAGLGGPDSGVRLYSFDDVGHMVPTERFEVVVRLLHEMIENP